ncbi:MAG: LemA family protein [Verrucomicrobiota bacterium]
MGAVAGQAGRERRDEAVAALRAQSGSGGVSAVAPSILALQEAYPDLAAVESFAALSRGLVETEQRIALARNFLNDSVMFHNIRIERVPDRFVAGLAGMRPEELFQAEGLERLPSAVRFG